LSSRDWRPANWLLYPKIWLFFSWKYEYTNAENL
jgi:hypothetical protein